MRILSIISILLGVGLAFCSISLLQVHMEIKEQMGGDFSMVEFSMNWLLWAGAGCGLLAALFLAGGVGWLIAPGGQTQKT